MCFSVSSAEKEYFLLHSTCRRGEVEEARRRLGAGLLLYVGDGEVAAFDGLQRRLPFFGLLHLALGGGEDDAAVEGGEHPVFLRLEVLYLEVAVDDHGQRGGLHAAYAEHLALGGGEAEGVEACGVHAEQPVADGAAEARLVEALVFALRLEVGEGLADGLFGEAADPEALHGAGGFGLLHHPALDELALLAGIAAVDDAVGGLHEALDDVELLLVALVGDELDAEARRYHGQRAEAPPLPVVAVVLRLLEGAEVAEGPGHLVAVALHVAVVRGVGPQHLGNLARHTGLLSNADNHFTISKGAPTRRGFLSFQGTPRGGCRCGRAAPRPLRRPLRSAGPPAVGAAP